MLEHEVFIGSNEVLVSGSVVVPKDQNTVSVKIQDLTFKFIFVYDGDGQRILYKGSAQELKIFFHNPPQVKWVGKTNDFLRVGNLGNDDIGLAYFIYGAKNQSHMLQYTFVKIGCDESSPAEGGGDE
ncbi:DUF6864 domain-containing function [Pseudomonas sp. microsymbiont 2]